MWSTLKPPEKILADSSRYGHSVVSYNDQIFMYGGFNGLLQNDIICFNPTSCSLFTSQPECVASVKYGVKCNWNKLKDSCEHIGTGISTLSRDNEKDKEKDSHVCIRGQGKKWEDNCLSFPTCSTCLQNKSDCVWCGSQCQFSKCKDSRHKVSQMFYLEQE